ncbi:MAG: hypothetical protein FWF15_03500 [Oscillospiraceae bacterium]|nr:hypothetical protein [Oscillospiraceae bacterium]
MINPLEITYYEYTGYSYSDEPANDNVINQNTHWTAPLLIKEFDASHLQAIKVNLTDDDLHKIDYLKITDTVTGERWYYFVAGHERFNSSVVNLRIVIDNFASVGLENISFFGNVARRSLSTAESANYPQLPEPWAPRRPLKTRKMIIDLNTNKKIVIPSHISTSFTEETSNINNTQTIHVPQTPIGIPTAPDSLSISANLPMGYPNPAGDTNHTINTPWGSISYTTPYETYYELSGTALSTFLEKAKKYNALDLIEPPYYVPNPQSSQNITIPELSNSNIRNKKASKYYTTITIRSLASGASQTYSDDDTDLQYNQPLTIIIAPDKTGGIYVIPTTIRDTGLHAYLYLTGVYSPFETVTYNAVGDTPGKFASDGTILLNTALNNLFQTYINKVNAMQLQGMQTKYFKSLGDIKSLVNTFTAEILGSLTAGITRTAAYIQDTTTQTYVPTTTQTTNQSQSMPSIVQNTRQTSQTGNYATSQFLDHRAQSSFINTTQNSSMTNPARNQTQLSYSYTSNANSGSVSIPNITTSIAAHSIITNTMSQSGNPSIFNVTGSINYPSITQNINGTTTIPSYVVSITGATSTSAYTQNSNSKTSMPEQISTSETITTGSKKDIRETLDEIEINAAPIFEIALDTLKGMFFQSYRNEIHSFMLGNINDYLNRWVSIQNDMHNGKVANLFKNITLIGGYKDYNKLVGKYEITIASLQPEDEFNFDLFLEHFGHAVDEYTNTLVNDVKNNYNYTLVGEDAILSNSVKQDASAVILNQFRTGVRVWKTTIRPENF